MYRKHGYISIARTYRSVCTRCPRTTQRSPYHLRSLSCATGPTSYIAAMLYVRWVCRTPFESACVASCTWISRHDLLQASNVCGIISLVIVMPSPTLLQHSRVPAWGSMCSAWAAEGIVRAHKRSNIFAVIKCQSSYKSAPKMQSS